MKFGKRKEKVAESELETILEEDLNNNNHNNTKIIKNKYTKNGKSKKKSTNINKETEIHKEIENVDKTVPVKNECSLHENIEDKNCLNCSEKNCSNKTSTVGCYHRLWKKKAQQKDNHNLDSECVDGKVRRKDEKNEKINCGLLCRQYILLLFNSIELNGIKCHA